jgi:ApbE superfamily uncharacterized protein (UPF0280 family)
MVQAQAALLPGGRLHLSEGPIDLVIAAWGETREVQAAYRQAEAAFDGLLRRLVAELDLLRRPLAASRPAVHGPVAGRMVDAVWPYRDIYITPMAAVAGAVADHVLEAMVQVRRLDRAFVNNGGDIAVHLTPLQRLRLGMVGEVEASRLDGAIELRAGDGVGGLATSGHGGRSFSLGIADAVTVLAASAAAADAAATVIANAVDVRHPSIVREPARAIDPDSDLRDLAVTVRVGDLDPPSVAVALDAGAMIARDLQVRGRIVAAALRLRGQRRLVGALATG